MTAFAGTALGNPAYLRRLDGPSRSASPWPLAALQLEKVKPEEGKRAHPSDEDNRDDRDDESAGQAIVSYLLFPLHFFPLHCP